MPDPCSSRVPSALSVLNFVARFLSTSPAQLVCVDQDETGVFTWIANSRLAAARQLCGCHVADVGCLKRMKYIFDVSRPEAIFHAAAYKHVPLMEENVPAAVQNNGFGLMNLLDLACECCCQSLVFISSDKAVNPCNVMRATKRLGELIIAHQPANGMRGLTVRFGNVLGSNGSLILVLQQQLRKHEPLTVTHPGIKRFFMTIREAVSLVLQPLSSAHKATRSFWIWESRFLFWIWSEL